MIKIDINIDTLNKLNSYIDKVNNFAKMKTDKELQLFIQNKCWNTLQEIMQQRLGMWETTNDNELALYVSSNHLKELENGTGFIIYNDAKVPAQTKSAMSYPDGMFSIALAFEYGVGIVGSNTKSDSEFFKSWDYNVNNYNFGWYYPTDDIYTESSTGYAFTQGYVGFEIYRYTADAITKNLVKWVNEYIENKEKR